MRVQKIHVIDRNKQFPGRKPNLYLRYAHPVHGRKVKPVQEKAKPGVKAMAKQIADLRQQMKNGTWVHPKERTSQTILFEAYALRVVEKRTAKGVGKNESPPNKTERGHVVNHLIPAFGKLTLPEVASFKVILTAFDGDDDDDEATRATRINYKGLAGRTIRNIQTVLRTILLYAVDDGLIDTPPPSLQVKRDHIPPPRDKDPEWRASSKFSKREVVTLAKCEEVPWLFRVLLVTYFYTGPRFNELHLQRVRHYDRDLEPLCCLTVKASKLGRHATENQVRHVPVHPELQAWLDWWLDEAWPFLYGRKPLPDDYLFPTLSKYQTNRGVPFITYQAFAYQFRENILPAAGLQSTRQPPPGVRRRERGIHSARHTFISLMRSAGADDKLLRAMTHQGTEERVLDMYTHWDWEKLCAEVRKLTIGLPPPPYERRPPVRLVTRGPSSDAGSESPAFKGSAARANASVRKRT